MVPVEGFLEKSRAKLARENKPCSYLGGELFEGYCIRKLMEICGDCTEDSNHPYCMDNCDKLQGQLCDYPQSNYKCDHYEIEDFYKEEP